MRLIDADELIEKYGGWYAEEGPEEGFIGTIETLVNTMPSAQPEIIRCKDCLMHGVCRFEQGLGLDGYCSQAERGTDE